MISRRRFLICAGVTPFAAPLHAFQARVAGGRPLTAVGYGPLAPVTDMTTGLPLLELPQGFRYASLSWSGDAMTDGALTPGRHDGMAAFQATDGLVALVRNHEVLNAQPGQPRTPAFGDNPYDPEAGGGTTTIRFDPKAAKAVSVVPSLSGTLVNCAGGPTPWGSWLSCEETVVEPKRVATTTKPHGYIFEVPHDGVSDATPLAAMGRFVHEAIAVDPATGVVYETEDRAAAGLYRFLPKTRTRLADGGTLQMLAIAGKAKFDTRAGQGVGEQVRRAEYEVEWVSIDDPERAHVNERDWDTRGVFQQGADKGGATFARLEGAWFGNERLFITATSGGDARAGQVWELDPKRNTLRLLFESPGNDVLAAPDNITLSRRGGLAICEDGPNIQRVQGLTTEGQLIVFARNNIVLNGERNGFVGDYRRFEFAGVTYSPDGEWMFVNVQQPGITFAITGPWGEGML